MFGLLEEGEGIYEVELNATEIGIALNETFKDKLL